MTNDHLIISNHARLRMDKYNINTDYLISIIQNDKIIETNPSDFPCPSALLLGNLKDSKYHIVLGNCNDHIRIITLYIPSIDQWDNFRIRKSRKNETKSM